MNGLVFDGRGSELGGRPVHMLDVASLSTH